VTNQNLKPVLERVYESGSSATNGVVEEENVPVSSSTNQHFPSRIRMSIVTMLYVICE
jgi:hypothetical protein